MIINVMTATGTQALWKQERIVLYVSAADKVKFYTNLDGSAAAPVATYTPNSEGDLYVDVTDYVRAHDSVAHLYLVDTDAGTTYDTQVEVKGLIDPTSALVPLHKANARFQIIPPAKIIAPFTQVPIKVGTYAAVGTNAFRKSSDPTQTIDAQDGTTIPAAWGNSFLLSYVRIMITPTWVDIPYQMTPQRCDITYAMVRWESFTGAQRCHTFEVSKQKSDTAGAYSLLPIDNEYIDIKGHVDGFTLRIDGLSAYDLWYYADVINSSKVEVTLDGYSWERVQVVTKTITLPDGESGTDGKLEIQVNYKRYDAVAM